jgi:two-component system sensor histidine kinase DesK
MAPRPMSDNPLARLTYVWLIYLASPIAFAVMGWPTDRTMVATSVVAIAAFLPLYFYAYRVDGRRALAVVAGIAGIGAALSPVNPGGTVFFVYAGALACRLGRPRDAVMVLAAVMGVLALDAWLGALPAWAWGWTVIATPLIGGVLIYMTAVGVRLRQAEAEARHLAVVAERERIGRDLHDLLGHTLSVIAIKAELATKLVERDPARSLAEVRDLERIARDALAEVRRSVLTTPQPRGFAQELAAARSVLDTVGVTLEADASAVRLDPAVDRTLAFALREAITNVIRHARARTCRVHLAIAGDRVRLTIADDGVGSHQPGGSGLSGMRRRVAELGGTLDARDEAGTILAIELPLQPSGSAVAEGTA